MERCNYYDIQYRYNYNTGVKKEIGRCNGTKECEECSCGGDRRKCDFYAYIREQAEEEFDAEVRKALKDLQAVHLMPVEDQYLSQQEILNLVIDGAQTLNKKVPAEFLERLFNK